MLHLSTVPESENTQIKAISHQLIYSLILKKEDISFINMANCGKKVQLTDISCGDQDNALGLFERLCLKEDARDAFVGAVLAAMVETLTVDVSH